MPATARTLAALAAAVAASACHAAASGGGGGGSAVVSLPGYPHPIRNMYAGEVGIGAPARGAKMFYWLCGATATPVADAPVVVWFQGGGGASPPWGKQTGAFAEAAYAGGGAS